MANGTPVSLDDALEMRRLRAAGESYVAIGRRFGRQPPIVKSAIARLDRAAQPTQHSSPPSEAALPGGGEGGETGLTAGPNLRLPEHVQRARESLRRFMPDAEAAREAIRFCQRVNEGSQAPASAAPVVRKFQFQSGFRLGVHVPNVGDMDR